MIKVDAPKKPLLTCNSDLICLGESVALKAYECNGEVQWSNGMVGQTITVTPTATSKYTATCAIGTCKSEASDTLCINVGQPLKPFITCRANTICLGDAATLTAQGCTGIIVWSIIFLQISSVKIFSVPCPVVILIFLKFLLKTKKSSLSFFFNSNPL